MASSAVSNARAVTAQAFAAGKVPAPYYLFLLMRAQGAAMAPATSVGCASPATAGGTVYVQRYCAGSKGPTAVRTMQWRQVLVPTRKRTGNGRTKYVKVWACGREILVP